MSYRYVFFTVLIIVCCIFTRPTEINASNASFFNDQLEAMNKQIKHYEELVEGGGWPILTSGKKLTLGDTSPRVAELRTILQAMGDYQAAPKTDASAELYDATLEDAVKHFQTRHGLEADGVVGKGTQDELRVSADKRLAQLKLNAERLKQFAANYVDSMGIVVNLPAYELYVVEQNDITDSMRVIIGGPKNKTPLMDNIITHLQFQPNWYVPKRIAAQEMLPKIQNNPDYLERSGFILSRAGQRINASDVDWSQYDAGHFPFSIMQKSGDGNALGKVKFHIPDSNAIYLHDTANPKLFANSFRALSHGCVRVEDPLALTQFVMKYGLGTPALQAADLYNSNVSKRVELEQSVPVHIVYWTAWVDPETKLVYFYDDVYGRDK